jgi:hypothetical protein
MISKVFSILTEYCNVFLVKFRVKKDMVLIAEYPKCGGTWLRNMVQDSLGQNIYGEGNNNKKGLMTLVRSRGVIQRHWLNKSEYFKSVIVIIREPKDVFNSYYFHEMYHKPNVELKNNIGYDENKDDRYNMKRYIDYKMSFPKNSPPMFSYDELVKTYFNQSNVCFVKYEDLKLSPIIALENVLTFLGNDKVSKERLNEVVNKFEMKSGGGKNSHVRKGIIGDWKNNMDAETAFLIDKNCSFVKTKFY